jgi:hypothetical protein
VRSAAGMGSSTVALADDFRLSRLPVESRMLNSAKVTGRSTAVPAPLASRLPGRASASLVGSSGVMVTVYGPVVPVVSRALAPSASRYGPASVVVVKVWAVAGS